MNLDDWTPCNYANAACTGFYVAGMRVCLLQDAITAQLVTRGVVMVR